MANNPSVSEVYDKNGVIADIEAKRFDGTRTFALSGDVSGSQTWNGDSSTNMTINASIGAKKVTTDKINDKAVGTTQIDDDAVGLAQINDSAMNGTVQDNDSKLATHAAVKTYVDSQISGQGTYLGKHTVAEVNAMQTDSLHNGDRVMLSDSGTINLGPGGVGFDVVAGEDLILYKSGSTVQWDSMDGNFKTKQSAISVSGLGTTKTITSLSQNSNGEISATASEIRTSSTSQTGLVQLQGSIGASESEDGKAATPKSVRDAINDLDVPAVGGDGKIITAISESDGKISATAKTMDSTPTAGHSDTTVTSEGIKAAIDAVDIGEVVAAALVDLDARISANEDAVNETNLGERTADKLDVQVLTSWGGGPGVRSRLKKMKKDMLSKRLVIYMMTARDFWQSPMEWDGI